MVGEALDTALLIDAGAVHSVAWPSVSESPMCIFVGWEWDGCYASTSPGCMSVVAFCGARTRTLGSSLCRQSLPNPSAELVLPTHGCCAPLPTASVSVEVPYKRITEPAGSSKAEVVHTTFSPYDTTTPRRRKRQHRTRNTYTPTRTYAQPIGKPLLQHGGFDPRRAPGGPVRPDDARVAGVDGGDAGGGVRGVAGGGAGGDAGAAARALRVARLRRADPFLPRGQLPVPLLLLVGAAVAGQEPARPRAHRPQLPRPQRPRLRRPGRPRRQPLRPAVDGLRQGRQALGRRRSVRHQPRAPDRLHRRPAGPGHLLRHRQAGPAHQHRHDRAGHHGALRRLHHLLPRVADGQRESRLQQLHVPVGLPRLLQHALGLHSPLRHLGRRQGHQRRLCRSEPRRRYQKGKIRNEGGKGGKPVRRAETGRGYVRLGWQWLL